MSAPPPRARGGRPPASTAGLGDASLRRRPRLLLCLSCWCGSRPRSRRRCSAPAGRRPATPTAPALLAPSPAPRRPRPRLAASDARRARRARRLLRTLAALLAVPAPCACLAAPAPGAAPPRPTRRGTGASRRRWARPGDLRRLFVREAIAGRVILGRSGRPPARRRGAKLGDGRGAGAERQDDLDRRPGAPRVARARRSRPRSRPTCCATAGPPPRPRRVLRLRPHRGDRPCPAPRGARSGLRQLARRAADGERGCARRRAPRAARLADADFWYAAAAKLLAPLLLAAATSGRVDGRVVRWVDTQEEVEVRDALSAHGDDRGASGFEASLRREERQRSSIYTTAETVLAAYADPRVLEAARAPEISAAELLDGGAHTLYLCAPAHEQRRLAPLFADADRGDRRRRLREGRTRPAGRSTRRCCSSATSSPTSRRSEPRRARLDRRRPGAAAGLGLPGPGPGPRALGRAVAQRWSTTTARSSSAPGSATPRRSTTLARVLGDEEIAQLSHTAGREGNARPPSRRPGGRWRPLPRSARLSRAARSSSTARCRPRASPCALVPRPGSAQPRLRRCRPTRNRLLFVRPGGRTRRAAAVIARRAPPHLAASPSGATGSRRTHRLRPADRRDDSRRPAGHRTANRPALSRRLPAVPLRPRSRHGHPRRRRPRCHSAAA